MSLCWTQECSQLLKTKSSQLLVLTSNTSYVIWISSISHQNYSILSMTLILLTIDNVTLHSSPTIYTMIEFIMTIILGITICAHYNTHYWWLVPETEALDNDSTKVMPQCHSDNYILLWKYLRIIYLPSLIMSWITMSILQLFKSGAKSDNILKELSWGLHKSHYFGVPICFTRSLPSLGRLE